MTPKLSRLYGSSPKVKHMDEQPKATIYIYMFLKANTTFSAPRWEMNEQAFVCKPLYGADIAVREKG